MPRRKGWRAPTLDVHAAATLYIGMIQGLVLQTSILRGQSTLTARTLTAELRAPSGFPAGSTPRRTTRVTP